jgi:hypothetical protein
MPTESKRSQSGAPDQAPATGEAIEQRVIAFAEQVGRLAGTLQSKADTLTDRRALAEQLTRIRDGAAALLANLAGGATTRAAAPPRGRTRKAATPRKKSAKNKAGPAKSVKSAITPNPVEGEGSVPIKKRRRSPR